jgi:hypothetical protein
VSDRFAGCDKGGGHLGQLDRLPPDDGPPAHQIPVARCRRGKGSFERPRIGTYTRSITFLVLGDLGEDVLAVVPPLLPGLVAGLDLVTGELPGEKSCRRADTFGVIHEGDFPMRAP